MNAKSATEKVQDCNSRPMFLQFIRHARAAALVLCAALLLPAGAFALGFRVPNQDAEAIARGNAFAATADNPSAIYYNPAGITQLQGESVQFGVHALSINSFFDSSAGRGSSESKFNVAPVPQLFITCSPTNMPFSFGVGLYAPYGLSVDWPVGSPFRSDQVFYGRLSYITLNPVAAWKINDQLSLAVGPTINYAQVVLRRGVGPNPFGISEYDFRGDDFAFGFTAGILWHPVEKWSFGASYHSPTTMNFGGHSAVSGGFSGSSPSSAEAPFAQFILGGVSFRPTTNWNFEADVDWTDWHSLKTVHFISPGFTGTPLSDVPFPFNWKSSVLLEFGGTRYLDKGYFASAGFFFSENSTTSPDFTPIVPDTDLYVGSVGFGHKGKVWDWTLAAQIITGPPREVNSVNNPTANGSYQWINGSLDFSVRYHF